MEKKKVLKIYSFSREKYEEFYKWLFENTNTEIDVMNFSDLYLKNWEFHSFADHSKFDFSYYDLYWQTIGSYIAKAFYYVSQANNAKTIDARLYDKSFFTNNKLIQDIIIHSEGFSWMNSLYFYINLDDFSIEKYTDLIEEYIHYPVIAKKVDVDRGEWVYMIESKKELEKIIHEANKDTWWLLFQQFEENDGDYRIIYFKWKHIGSMRRYNEGHFLNNVSTWWNIEKADIPEHIIEKLSSLWDVLWLDIIGVDIFLKWDTYKVIEINDTPQLLWFSKLFKNQIVESFEKLF